MSALLKEKPLVKAPSATAEDVKKTISDAFKAAFTETGVKPSDFTWFSNKPL